MDGTMSDDEILGVIKDHSIAESGEYLKLAVGPHDERAVAAALAPCGRFGARARLACGRCPPQPKGARARPERARRAPAGRANGPTVRR